MFLRRVLSVEWQNVRRCLHNLSLTGERDTRPFNKELNVCTQPWQSDYDCDNDRCVVVYGMQVTITQTGKHQTTLFVLSVSTDPSLHCLLVCLVVKYPVHNESQNLGPSVSGCGEYTALCCNCDSTRTSILSVSVLNTSLEISPPPPSAHSLSRHFLPCLLLSFSLPSPPLSPLLLHLLN